MNTQKKGVYHWLVKVRNLTIFLNPVVIGNHYAFAMLLGSVIPFFFVFHCWVQFHCLLIVIKDVFLSEFLLKSKNLMDRIWTPSDRTADHPATKWLDPPTTKGKWFSWKVNALRESLSLLPSSSIDILSSDLKILRRHMQLTVGRVCELQQQINFGSKETRKS